MSDQSVIDESNPLSGTDCTVCQPGSEGQVTVSISRKVKRGRETDYEHWISGIIKAAASYPGHLGTSVLRPSAATNDEYVSIYRFDSYAHCQAWEQSELRQQWLDKLQGLIVGEPRTLRGTGLEFWFDLPELPSTKSASPAKMALVLIVVVYLLVMGVNFLFHDWLVLLAPWLQTLLVVSAQVLLLTYVVMPRVTQLLKPWLFKQ